MTKRDEVYVCQICGNQVEVLRAAGGVLTCCGQAMTLQQENTVDAAQEKHVPCLEKTGDGYLVTVGSVAHPMGEDHFIEWIELIVDGHIHRHHLKPGEEPKAHFPVTGSDVKARAFCNLHGLWKS